MFFRGQINQFLSQNETPVLHHVPHSAPNPTTSCVCMPPMPHHHEGRRRWTTGELTEIVAALATLRTGDIAHTIGVNPKALRSVLRRNGISLRALRQHAKNGEPIERMGLVVRRSRGGPSATYGADALTHLDDSACRWPLGDPAAPGFAFCGAPRLGRASYCRDHLSQAFERDGDHGL